MSQYHEMKYQQKYFPFSWFQLGVGKSGGVIFFFQFQRGGEGYLKHYSIYDWCFELKVHIVVNVVVCIRFLFIRDAAKKKHDLTVTFLDNFF